MRAPDIYLASQSPRRRELLAQIGIHCEVVSVDVPETRQVNESPEDFVQRLALDKARAGWQVSDQACPVLGADTIVVLGDRILGKPVSDEDAEAMLAALSGQTHTVMTAVAMIKDEHQAIRLNISQVTFRETTELERQAYIATGEPADKAGGYGIQGHAAVFIQQLQGSYSSVMGLPLFETGQLLEEFAIPVI